MLYLLVVKIMPEVHASQLIELVIEQITRTRTPVLTIFFIAPMPSVSPYLNPISLRNPDVLRRQNGHISYYLRADSFSGLKNMFAFISTSNYLDGTMIMPPQ